MSWSQLFVAVGSLSLVILFFGAATYNAITTHHPGATRSAAQHTVVAVFGALDNGNGLLQVGPDIVFDVVLLGVPAACFVIAWRLRNRKCDDPPS